MCGSKSRTTIKEDRTKIKAFETWCWSRRVLRISWTERVTNEKLNQRIKKKKKIDNRGQKKKMDTIHKKRYTDNDYNRGENRKTASGGLKLKLPTGHEFLEKKFAGQIFNVLFLFFFYLHTQN